ncbi:tubulin-specific chaperone C-like [Ornithodoros turicata]|uniref:tubulin-specific chaperone C-like n=1 Tax=Ornithodoros turicata TaxID=34597 RepID=UPI0031387A1D
MAENTPRHQAADAVIAEFSKAKRSMEMRLAQCCSEGDCSQLNALQEELQAIQQKVTDASGYLPSANLRWLQNELKDLKTALGKAGGQLKPRSRFAFKDRKVEPTGGAEAKPIPSTINNATQHKTSKAICDPNVVGFRGKSNETLDLTAVNGKNVELASLSNCNITIKSNPATLFLHALTQCQIHCGPVTTSVFIEDCRDCTFSLACQQLRVHGTENSDLKVCVSTRTILEDCKKVRIGRYDWQYEGDEADWGASGLDRDTNNWRAVDDFNWLAIDKPSPNWSFLN